MCGIFAIIARSPTLDDPNLLKHLELLKRRGPDSSNSVTTILGNGFYLHLLSYVLHLRGDEIVTQPYKHENGDVLQWNGEIFGGLQVGDHECDTTILSNTLSSCSDESAICDTLRTIHGPWALIFYQKSTKKIWFGLDYFGRRSLLYHRTKDSFILSSVMKKPASNNEDWTQVKADGIYMINTTDLDKDISINCYPWRSITQPNCSKFEALRTYNPDYVNSMTKPLNTADFVNILLNTSIGTFSSNFTTVFPEISNNNLPNYDLFAEICGDKSFSDTVYQFLETLRQSVRKRVVNVPRKTSCSSSVGVLFSGGIDCTILALLADEFVAKEEPIVLLNVAFETPTNNGTFDVPDRITGRSALKELESLRPERQWNFIEVNITLAELQQTRKEIISDLTYPLATVLDDSIGCALWFAARGAKGTVESTLFDTKVLLSGLGADEQLCGYARHRTAFTRGGWFALENEIKLEIERLSARNLGRDDRIVSDHGKEARFPYLDENVVAFLNQTPLSYKANFSFKRGVGEKILLRAVGYVLGLRDTAVLPKRAIQFGSRIAKAEGKREKASDVCKRLL